MVKMWEEILEQPAVLKGCIDINREAIKSIVGELGAREIDSVVIAARGTSDHAGVYGKYVIEYAAGLPVSLAAPSIYTVYGRKVKLEKSLVIGISQSGKAEDVLQVLKSAGESGALTVSITNDEASPLAATARYHLYCGAGVEKSVAATKTFTSQMYVLAWLVAEWTGNEEMKAELEQVPGEMLSLFAQAEDIKSKVQRYRYINECFVLGRGINYSITLEAALKIQETNYVRAKAYATSDFYHGPFAMVEKDMPVMLFAPEGPSLEDLSEMAAKLKAVQAELLIVSNNEELLELAQCAFRIPRTSSDIISPFYNVVIAQMFACQLALAKGLDPDAPRGLKKVTITR